MEAKDIHKEMLPMYGEHCPSRQAVHNWVQKFSEGRIIIEDEHPAVERAVRVVPTATKRIFRRRFPGTCETWDKCLNLYGDYVEKKMLFVCHYLHSILFNHDL